jgi:hypothetical protein
LNNNQQLLLELLDKRDAILIKEELVQEILNELIEKELKIKNVQLEVDELGCF